MQSLRWLTAALLVPFLASSASAEQTIRITTWNLHWFPSGSPKLATLEAEQATIRRAAAALNVLNPDVVLLQEVRDHKACTALVDALKPSKYHVLVCSAFKDPVGEKPGWQQVAILSKIDGEAAWAEKWTDRGPVDPPRGFAFAIIPIQFRRIGFYCVHLKSNLLKGDREREEQMNILKRETSAERLLGHMNEISNDYQGLKSFVVAGDFNTNPDDPKFVSERTFPLFANAAFLNPILKLPATQRVTWPSDGKFRDATFDYILCRGLVPVGNPEILATKISDHRPVTLELSIP